MELENNDHTNGENQASEDACNDEGADPPHPGGSFYCFPDDVDITCSTPYVSAPSSLGRGGHPNGCFYSVPASLIHFVLSSSPYSCVANAGGDGTANVAADSLVSGLFEFEFATRFAGTGSGATSATGSMISADELFLNGQIRLMDLSSHLQRPQVLPSLLDLEGEEDKDEEAGERNEALTLRGKDLKIWN